jgi:hypothetical protein
VGSGGACITTGRIRTAWTRRLPTRTRGAAYVGRPAGLKAESQWRRTKAPPARRTLSPLARGSFQHEASFVCSSVRAA